MENKERLLLIQKAANYLNGLEEPAEVVAVIKSILPLVESGVRLTGDRSVLNPLLDSYEKNPVEFRSIVRMIIQARAQRDWSTRELKLLLVGETEEERLKWSALSINIKNEFTRKYVKNTRERLKRALNIENNKRAYDDRIRGTDRLVWEQKKWQEWTKQKEDYVRDGKEGRLSRAYIAERTAEFWDIIDDQLDKLEGR